jgi:hypothetical protein
MSREPQQPQQPQEPQEPQEPRELEGRAPQSYAELIARNAEFTLFARGRGTRFTGARGERAAYEALVRVPDARIADAVARVDFARTIRDLVHGHYTSAAAGHSEPRPAHTPHTYTGELDGKKMYVEFGLSSGRLTGRLTVHAHEDPYEYMKGTEVEMEIVRDIDDSTVDFLGPRYAAIADDIRALRQLRRRSFAADGAHGAPVVFVTDMRVSPLRWSERPLRMMHAAIALCAQLGLISGASLVVVDKRGYGLALMPCTRMLEHGLTELARSERTRYLLEPIGQSLLFGRADELVERLRDFDAYRYTRASQVGASPPTPPLWGTKIKIG